MHDGFIFAAENEEAKHEWQLAINKCVSEIQEDLTAAAAAKLPDGAVG